MFQIRDAEALERSEQVQREFEREWNERQQKWRKKLPYIFALALIGIVLTVYSDVRDRIPPSSRIVYAFQIAAAVLCIWIVASLAILHLIKFSNMRPEELKNDRRSDGRLMTNFVGGAVLFLTIGDEKLWLSFFLPQFQTNSELWVDSLVGSLVVALFMAAFASPESEMKKMRRKVEARLGLLD